jgi:hypothetical protein
MSSTTITRLLAGDATIHTQFAQAKAFWDTFFNNHANASEGALAELLGNAQTQFYWAVAPNDYAFAKEIRVCFTLGAA